MVRVSFIEQMEVVECGAASLAMGLAALGHHAPLSEVREAYNAVRVVGDGPQAGGGQAAGAGRRPQDG